VPTLYVVIPFFNEGRTLARCVQRVRNAPLPGGWSVTMVLVDDHSDAGDRSLAASVAERLRDEGLRVWLRRHEVNQGKGAALQTGYDVVLAADPRDDDLVIIQDADLEYDPADFRRLMDPLLGGEADAVIGSRWANRRVAGIKRTLHAWGNGALSRLSNLMTGYRLSDMECCYKLTTVSMLRRLRPLLSEARYGVEPQIVAALSRLEAQVVEVPVSYDPRSMAEGKKIGWQDGVRALYVIIRERCRRAPAAPPHTEPGR
jgi:glycosyltransferase involved in cell wall biosynthesis